MHIYQIFVFLSVLSYLLLTTDMAVCRTEPCAGLELIVNHQEVSVGLDVLLILKFSISMLLGGVD